jgi:hypothetical protein
MAAMTEIKAHRISCEQPSHQGGNAFGAGPEQEVSMIWEKCPRVAYGLGLREQGTESIHKIFSVFVAPEYGTTFDSTDHHVVESAGRIYSGFSRHDLRIPQCVPLIN